MIGWEHRYLIFRLPGRNQGLVQANLTTTTLALQLIWDKPIFWHGMAASLLYLGCRKMWVEK
jgi:hypothetical protein